LRIEIKKDTTIRYDPEIENDAYKFLGAYIGAISALQFSIIAGHDGN
jgi:hypothetical protein